MAEELTWRDEALDIYRFTFGSLPELPTPKTVRGAYMVDELRDALFDLKQAFIDGNEDFARRAMKDVKEVVKAIRKLISEGQDL